MLVKLKETINPDVIVDISDADKTILIKEDGADSKIKKLLIKGVPSNTFAFSLDHQPGGRDNRFFKQLSCYINAACDSGVNKGCDLVVVSQLDDGGYDVLIFDLKSDKPRKDATEKQLLNSELYVKYLMSMLESHCQIDISNIKYRRAIVTTDARAVRKNPTYRPNKSVASDTNYKVKNVTVNRAKESSVHYGAL